MSAIGQWQKRFFVFAIDNNFWGANIKVINKKMSAQNNFQYTKRTICSHLGREIGLSFQEI